jgi:predicted acylesterase/phospholipase RssA
MERRQFLGALSSVPLATLATPAPAAVEVPPVPRVDRHALVLAGGANRGAYEAGVIGGLAARAGLRDGEPLGFDAICGTSIGAINGFFIATAQYTALRQLWRTVASEHIFTLKRRFRRILEPSAGVITRAYQGVALGLGLTSSVRGVLDRDRMVAFLGRIVDPAAPAHIPLYISATNLTRQRGATFVRPATTPAGLVLQRQNDDLIAAFAHGEVRAVSDAALASVLLASAALPTLIDPVTIVSDDGSSAEEYVDGGVTDNVPVEIARRCAAHLHVILVDPPQAPTDARYPAALQIGLGVFQTMQQRILEYQALLAIAESAIVPSALTQAARLYPLPIEPTVIRPSSPLPGAFGDFDTLADLDAAWQRGYDDGVAGWPPSDALTLATGLSIL